jgi:dihydrofolate reductase
LNKQGANEIFSFLSSSLTLDNPTFFFAISSKQVFRNQIFLSQFGAFKINTLKKQNVMNRKVTVFIAMSLDGYIAKPNDDLSFLSIVEQEGQDYGYQAFVDTIDTVIMGRKTYEWVMSQVPKFPHHDKNAYIITHTSKPSIGTTHFYTGSLKELIIKLKTESGKGIFVDGGAEIVNEMLKDDLVDELIISVIPILVGDGTRLFKDHRPEQRLTLVSAQHFAKGLVQLHYKRG